METQPSSLEAIEVKPGFCEVCGAGPYQPAGLGSHKRTVHNIVGTSLGAVYTREQNEKAKRGRPPKMRTQDCPYCDAKPSYGNLNRHIAKSHPGKDLVNPSKSVEERKRHNEADRKRRAKLKEAGNVNGVSSAEIDPFVHGFAVATCRKELEAIAERSEVDLAVLTRAVKSTL
jgi:hypothetical protein